MIDLLWTLMIQFGKLIVPLIALYVCFDFIGMLLFNKR